MPPSRKRLRLLCTTALLSLAALAPLEVLAHDVTATYQNVGDFTYKVELEGAPDKLKKPLLELTEAYKQQENPPPTLYLLQRRLTNDADLLVKALQAEGYYDAKVEVSIDSEKEPYLARFIAHPGEVYTLASAQIVVDPRGATTELELPDPATLGLKLGGPVNYAQINDARVGLRNRVHDLNCLRNLRIRNHLRIDPNTRTAEAVYRVRGGESAKFGKLTINGLESVEAPYIERKVPWKQGDCFKPTRMEDLQLSLLQSNLFSTSDAVIEEKPNESGEVDIVLNMRERKHRTIKAGIGYATENGLDFKPVWEHRNFFGQGEKVTVEGTIATFMQSVKGRFERPDFLRREQTLVLESELAQEETDAYDTTRISALAQVSRPLRKHLRGALGVAYSLRRVDDQGLASGEETFSLLSLPSYLEHKTRNSDIDPTKGHQLRFDFEPFVDTLDTDTAFLKTQASAKWYHQHEDLPLKPTWALRGLVGSIIGSSNVSLPADERFYSGGGGSTRGYGYQMLGPLLGGSPTGGRSIIEFSTELRLRVSESIGLVPFFDAGNVYEEITPDFGGDLFYAAGLGLRYYSDFGPFRLDIATPLNGRDTVDDDYQIYISFGQSF